MPSTPADATLAVELRHVFDSMPQLVAVFGADRKRLYANRPAVEYLGTTIEEWQSIADPIWFFHPDDRERVATDLYAGRERDVVAHEFEARIRRKDGIYRWFLLRGNPVCDECGRLASWYLSATDIEERKRAEEWLQTVEEQLSRERDRLSLLLEINDHVVGKRSVDELFRAVAASIRKRMDTDAAGLWLVNGQSGCLERRLLDFPTGKGLLASVVGAMPAELENEYWRLRTPKVYRPQEATEFPAAICEACRAEGILSAVSVPLFGADAGALGLMTLSSRKADAFGPPDLQLLSQVATEISLALDNALAYEALRVSRDALRRTAAYLAGAESLTHTGSWAFDLASASYVYVSDECFRIFDLDPKRGLPDREAVARLIHPEDRDSVDAAFQMAIRERTDTSSEFRIETPKGTRKHVLTLRHAVVDDAGELVQLVGTVVDITERKLAQQELRESEMRFRAFVDHAADAFGVFDEEHKLVDVNREACESAGYTREELLGMVPQDFGPDIDAALLKKIDEQVEAGEVCTFETRQRRKDGTLFPVEVRVRLFCLGGRHLHLAVARDISQRKLAEEERREQSERFRAIADYTYDWEQWIGVDGTLLWVNPAVERITGYSVDECMAMPDFPLPIISVADRRAVASQMKAALEGSSRNDFEFRVQCKDGRPAWVAASWQPIHDSRGVRLGYRSSMRDIGERKRAEEALRESETRFRAFVDHAADAFFMLDERGTIIDVNETAFMALGYARDELIGRTPLAFDVDLDGATLESVTKMAAAGETVVFDRHRHRRKDGSVFPVEVHTTLFWHGGRRFLMKVARDITERVAADEALRRSEEERRRADLAAQNARAELERVARLTTMAELAASIAHEVNQPLAGLITSANAALNWLAGDRPNLPKAREALARTVRDGTRAGAVVNRIRGALKRTPPVKQRVNPNEIVRDVLTLMHGELQQCGVQVAVVLDPAVPDIVGDSIQLQQVILNTVKNGLEAIAGVEGRPGPLRIQSALSDLDGKAAALITVCDNGSGFGLTDPETLFEAFQTTKPHGMGMGLWISRWIVERHGGRLTAHANDGPGATFRILLPAADGDAA